MLHKTKAKVHGLLHPELVQTKQVRMLNGFIILLIILNVLAVMLETVPSIHEPYAHFFKAFDTISVIIFTIEYILRVWSSNHDPKYKHSLYGRIRYMLSAGALIDLLAILPFYIHVVVGLDLRVLRLLRLMRFLRLFHLTAFMHSAQLVRNVFKKRADDLKLSFVIVSFVIIIASCLVYFAEHTTQPEIFSSIPATVWWAIVTITTTGYGDMIPVTPLGQTIASIISLAAVAVVALPAGIITAGFLEEIRKSKNHGVHTCPHCGKALE
jgi:voltage-gated potassium channel